MKMICFCIRYCLHIPISILDNGHDICFFTMTYTVDTHVSSLQNDSDPSFLVFSCSLPQAAACTTVRLMRIDGPRTLNFLRSVAHRSTHMVSHFFHAFPYAACIECRFQMLTGISQVCQLKVA